MLTFVYTSDSYLENIITPCLATWNLRNPPILFAVLKMPPLPKYLTLEYFCA